MRTLGLLAALALGGCTVKVTRQPIVAPPPRAATPIVTPIPAVRTPAPPDPVTVDPEAAKVLEKGLATRAVLFSDSDPPKLTAIAVDDTSRSEARGMIADGSVKAAVLREGERASEPLPLSPGDCVTVIAHGGLGVMEVDAFILAPSPVGDVAPGDAPRTDVPRPDTRSLILAEDAKNGPIAIIGGQTGCFRFTGSAPIRAELVVQARRGAGPVVVRAFRAAPIGPAPPPKS